MNVDTSWVRESHKHIREEKGKGCDLRKIVAKQRKVEKVVMENTLNKFPHIFPDLVDLNTHKLKKLLRENFADYRVVETMRKIVNSVCSIASNTDFLDTDSSDGSENDSLESLPTDPVPTGPVDSIFYNWFTDFVKINNRGIFGSTYRVTFSNEPDMVVIKTPVGTDTTADDNLIHEAFVGYKLTNKLRRYIPNFMYVYGYHKISPPLELDGKIISGGSPGGYYDSMVCCMYEYIPGKTLTYELPFLTKREFILIIIQLILATRLAHSKFDWTHYDLHTGNVIIRRATVPQIITYPFEDRIYTIATNVIPVIIDYGMAHVKYHNNSYGFNLGSGQPRPDKSFPMFDMYKLIMGCGSILASNNRRLFKICHQVYQYFNSVSALDDFEVSIKEQKKYFFELPRSTFTTSVLTLDRYTRFIINLFPEGNLIDAKPNYNLIKMRYDHLLSLKNSELPVHLTIPCFNDIISNTIDGEARQNLLQRYQNIYDLVTEFNVDDISELLDILDSLHRDIKLSMKSFFNSRRLKYYIEGYFDDAVFSTALDLRRYLDIWRVLYARTNHLICSGIKVSQYFTPVHSSQGTYSLRGMYTVYTALSRKLRKREDKFIPVYTEFLEGKDKLYDSLKSSGRTLLGLSKQNPKEFSQIQSRLNYYIYEF